MTLIPFQRIRLVDADFIYQDGKAVWCSTEYRFFGILVYKISNKGVKSYFSQMKVFNPNRSVEELNASPT